MDVRGLGGRNCGKVRTVFRRQLKKSLVGRIDVLLIQEHHLNEQWIRKYGNLLPGQWWQLWVPTVGDNRLKAGLCIAINDICLSHFLHYGILSWFTETRRDGGISRVYPERFSLFADNLRQSSF